MMNTNVSETKNTKRFRPNIIDFLVVIAIIAAIAGIVIRTGMVRDMIDSAVDKNTPVQEARIRFLVRDINKDSYGTFQIGNEYKASNLNNCVVGTLAQLDPMTPAVKYTDTIDGRKVKTVSPLTDPDDPDSYRRIDVSGVILSRGKLDEQGCFLLDGKYPVMPGSELRLVNKDIDVLLTVMDVEIVEATEQAQWAGQLTSDIAPDTADQGIVPDITDTEETPEEAGEGISGESGVDIDEGMTNNE